MNKPFDPAVAARRFLADIAGYNALSESDCAILVEQNSGELNIFSGFWDDHAPDGVDREYDPCDAAYLLLGFSTMLDAVPDNERVDTANDQQARLWDLAALASERLMALVDFNESEFDWGVFCYEHLDTEDGGLVDKLFRTCYMEQTDDEPEAVDAVILAHAAELGWPLTH